MDIPHYSLETHLGMFVLGLVGTSIGAYFTINMIKTGEIIVLGTTGRVIIREKIREIMPLRFNYFYALIDSLARGPITLIIGLISFFVLISSIISQ